jgi:L-amino acid N-acyltransferase YncA
MTIREATPADIDSLGPLLLKHLARQELWDGSRYGLHPDMGREYRRWFGRLAEDPRSTVLVAAGEAGFVGFLVATVHRDRPIYRTGEYAVIHDLWLDDEAGDDAGREMLKFAAQRFAASGITQLRAATAAANERVRALLQGCGFHICQIDLLKELPAPKPRKQSVRPPAAGKGSDRE